MATESYVTIDMGEAGKVGIAAVDLGGGSLVAAKDRVAELGQVLGPIESFSKAVMDALKKAEPTSFTVELDFSVGIAAGGVLSIFGNASSSAAVKATLTWSKAAA